MAARLTQLRTKAAQAADFASKHGGAYYKEAMEKNKRCFKLLQLYPPLLPHVGCEIDAESLELLRSQVKGKDITELLAAGREKFASVPSGGGGAAVAAAAPTSGGASW